jgi:hypothetical protein
MCDVKKILVSFDVEANEEDNDKQQDLASKIRTNIENHLTRDDIIAEYSLHEPACEGWENSGPSTTFQTLEDESEETFFGYEGFFKALKRKYSAYLTITFVLVWGEIRP